MDSDADQVDEFDEYNPHPFQGGYDIALTYGPPLPPSPAICYPLSDAPPPSLPTPVHEPVTVAVPAPPLPSPPSRTPPEHEFVGVAAPEPAAPHDYGCQEPYPSDEPLNFWPYPSPIDMDRSCWSDLINDPQDWSRQWRRAANYLFGYSHGYGEKWAGIDSHGIPIYAYKQHAEQPIVVEIEPALPQKLDYYEDQYHSQNWQLSQSESYGEWDYREKDVHDQEYLVESSRYQTPSYDEVSKDEVPLLPWVPSYDEVSKDEVPLLPWQPSSYYDSGNDTFLYGTPNYAYNKNYYEEPLSVQVNPLKMASTHTVSYHEDNQEYISAEAKWHSTSNDESLEPFEPSWSRNPSYYGLSEEAPSEYNGVYSSYGEKMDESLVLGNTSYDYQTCYHDQSFCVQLEPFKSVWLQNPIIYEAYEEGFFPNSEF